jgi:ornithine carbamoyltransferase
VLKNRHFLKLDDFTQEEISFLLNLSAELKAAKYAHMEVQHLIGKQITLIFEKDSTRTRNSFEVAASDQGAQGYCTRPGSSIRRHRISRTQAGTRGRTGTVRRSAGMERLDQ